MQDKIIASHTCFGGHMDVNYHPSTHISTRLYLFLPVQMMGGRVSTNSYDTEQNTRALVCGQ